MSENDLETPIRVLVLLEDAAVDDRDSAAALKAEVVRRGFEPVAEGGRLEGMGILAGRLARTRFADVQAVPGVETVEVDRENSAA